MPSHTRRLNSFGYIWHRRARPCSNGTCTWCRLVSLPRLGHVTLTLFNTSCELLMILVRLRAGPWTGPELTRIPRVHMSTTSIITPSIAASLIMHASDQDEAPCGCSCTKNLPESICISYSLTQNSRCARPAAISAFTVSGSLLYTDSFWSCEKAVHGREPIRKIGFVSASNLTTRLCTLGSAKFHAFPVAGSARVRSRLQPGLRSMPFLSYSAAAIAILGCE